ncbi:branched-chain amino acid ABC transporter permease [Ferviditalea candida]|uniref:Branched-chain amino acid ABC transporter permease n=1 Tax=Ferviditalea candida TaxID=3108399 RepID=A0ABU5ZEB3_9BACL|nr:branched-chain amino acid ABC transporter permease [Paenibacillaceae bacterium T2]
MNKNKVLSIAAAIVILLLPSILSTYGIRLGGELFIMSIFALSLGLLMGYAGLTSFGHASFFGTGLYVVAILGKYITNTYVLILAAIVITGLLAWVTGLLFVRVPGSYFFMLTLAFNQLLYVFFFKLKSFGGADGMAINVNPDLGFGPIVSPVGRYYLTAIAFILCFIFLKYFIDSPTGRIVIGVKENQSRMKALGYNTLYYRVLAFTMTGMMAGFAGALYAFSNRFASPESISWMLSGQVLIMVIIGGSGTLIGPPIGAAVFVVLQSYISSYTERWPVIMGVFFLVLVFLNRGGIGHILIRLWNRAFPDRERTAARKSGLLRTTDVIEEET